MNFNYFGALAGALLLSLTVPAFAQESGRAKAPANESIGEKIDDAVLNTRVRAALVKDKAIGSQDIAVEANGKQVVLTGSVKTAEEKRKAESVAKSVSGVGSVRNELKVAIR
jgi:hyperosmotically inducible protein